LIAEGSKARKITPGNEEKLRKLAAKHGPEWLSAFLEAAVPAIGGELREASDVSTGTISAEQRKIYKQLGMTDEQIEQAAKADPLPKSIKSLKGSK
jgi:phage I-like protein